MRAALRVKRIGPGELAGFQSEPASSFEARLRLAPQDEDRAPAAPSPQDEEKAIGGSCERAYPVISMAEKK
jgi:hypothetical protein